KEAHYIYQAVYSGKISGNGAYTQKCQHFFQQKYGFSKALLTSSCTDALEMCGLLIDIKEGDEVILPSYTFVSTANAFMLRGAKLVFADCLASHPNLDTKQLVDLINPNTKAIVVVHYGGVACDMEPVLALAQQHQLYVIEDAAQAIDAYYQDQPLGSLGDLGTFSFHESKNIIAGEGGLLSINKPEFTQRAEIIWEKGTNRAAFWRGEVSKYEWLDIGSSYLPSEITAAFLYAQLENLDQIQQKRIQDWDLYYSLLSPLAPKIQLPIIPDYAQNNGHLFYIICTHREERKALIEFLKKNGILAVFHYLCLHQSPFFKDKHDGRSLPQAERFADCLLRLPMYYELKAEEIHLICQKIKAFYENRF
ncbi:MAG: dTDP-4-amino-4,6-dideoxygalactose transaminase, partial [Bacteroidota bacterium]